MFFPKSSTSKLQLLDQGIIATLKRNYRWYLMMSLVNSSMSVMDYLPQLKLKEAIHLAGAAWEGVKENRIRGCLKKMSWDSI